MLSRALAAAAGRRASQAALRSNRSIRRLEVALLNDGLCRLSPESLTPRPRVIVDAERDDHDQRLPPVSVNVRTRAARECALQLSADRPRASSAPAHGLLRRLPSARNPSGRRGSKKEEWTRMRAASSISAPRAPSVHFARPFRPTGLPTSVTHWQRLPHAGVEERAAFLASGPRALSLSSPA